MIPALADLPTGEQERLKSAIQDFLAQRIEITLGRIAHVHRLFFFDTVEQMVVSCGRENITLGDFLEYHDKEKWHLLSIKEVTGLSRHALKLLVLGHLNDFADDPENDSWDRHHQKIREGCILVRACEHLAPALGVPNIPSRHGDIEIPRK